MSCDACGKPVRNWMPVVFENTSDGGYLTHLDCIGDIT